jgi:hypothetical protein
MLGIIYLCKEYIGSDEKQLRVIKRMKTRWGCCFRNYPMVCMTERSIWLLNSMGGDNNNGADDSAGSDGDLGGGISISAQKNVPRRRFGVDGDDLYS